MPVPAEEKTRPRPRSIRWLFEGALIVVSVALARPEPTALPRRAWRCRASIDGH